MRVPGCIDCAYNGDLCDTHGSGAPLAITHDPVTDADLLAHMEQVRRYPFPNVGKWTMRVGPDNKKGGKWVHGATARECLTNAVVASRGLR